MKARTVNVKKNDLKDRLIGAAIVVVFIIMVVHMILSDIRKAEKEPITTAKTEAAKEAPAIEPVQAMPHTIFPSDDEAKKNLQSQLERQQMIEKSTAEKKQIMADVRKDVEGALSAQSAAPADRTNTVTDFTDEEKKLNLQKAKVAKFNTKGLVLHH